MTAAKVKVKRCTASPIERILEAVAVTCPMCELRCPGPAACQILQSRVRELEMNAELTAQGDSNSLGDSAEQDCIERFISPADSRREN
jgi:hypothetical protein